jgi:hypothetical protein
MGHVIIDLPDPLEHPNEIDRGEADALMAELAGLEIDRLLLKSGRGAQRGGEPPPQPSPGVPGEGEIEAEDAGLDPEVAAEMMAALSGQGGRPPPQPFPGVPGEGERGPQRRLAIWWRPLEWVNAPLAGAPDWWRDMVGKMAWVILINALLILGYVTFFR